MHVCMFVYLSVCLSVHLSLHLSVCLFVCLSVCLFVCLSVCLSVYLSMRWHSMLCVSTLTPQSCASRAVMRGFKVFVTLSPKNANTQM